MGDKKLARTGLPTSNLIVWCCGVRSETVLVGGLRRRLQHQILLRPQVGPDERHLKQQAACVDRDACRYHQLHLVPRIHELRRSVRHRQSQEPNAGGGAKAQQESTARLRLLSPQSPRKGEAEVDEASVADDEDQQPDV